MTADFVEAQRRLNADLAKFAGTFQALSQSFTSRPKRPKTPKPPKAEKTQEELEEEYWESSSATNAVAKITGDELSSARLIHEFREVEKKINDVNKAQELGLVSTKEAATALVDLQKEYRDLTLVAAGRTVGGAAGAKLASIAVQAPEKASGFALDQVIGVATGSLGLLAGTAIGGGLFGLLLHGIKSADRLQAEAGEIVNVFSAAGATASRGAISHFAAFQETAQTFYGVSRQEVQGVLREFMLAGVTVDEIMSVSRKGIGVVGHDAVTMTLGLDKMLELSSGFTAKSTMDIVRNQGESVDSAVDKISKIEMLAHRAGLGVEEFTQASVQAATELSNYGVTADSVAVALTIMQEKFQNIGMSSHTAMEYSQQATKEITSGVRGAGVGVQALLAEQTGRQASMAGRYEMLDALQRGEHQEFMTLVQGLHKAAKKQTTGTYGGDEQVREREYLERLGFGTLGSKAIFSIGEQVDAGKSIDEISKDEWAEIKKSFQVEGEKVSDLQKKSAVLSKGLAKVGQGVLLTMTNFMGLLIVSVKTMLAVDWKLSTVEGMLKSTVGSSVASILRGMGEAVGMSDATVVEANDVLKSFHEFADATAASARKAYSGVSDSTSALTDIVKPLLLPIVKAIEFGSPATGTEAGSKEPGLTAAFWRDFDDMANRLGVDPLELKKVITAETGWNAAAVNYVVGPDGKPKLDERGQKIPQAKGLGAWIHSTAIKVAGMTEEQWQNLENMAPAEQLPFLERYYKALRIKGLTAEQIHSKMFGEGYRGSNPYGAHYIASWFWTTPAGSRWLAEHPGFKLKNEASQYMAYEQNKQLDKERKGYITAEDVASTTQRCSKCGKVKFNCTCAKAKVTDAVRVDTTSGAEVKVTLTVPCDPRTQSCAEAP